MATKQDIKAGKAFVELFLKNSIAKGLQEAQKQITGFGKSVMSIGATFTKAGGAITAPLVGAATHFAMAGDALDKMAKRTGATATNLAELGYAAEQSGASLGDIESALSAMTSKGRSIGQFDALAESIAAIENPLVRAQRATAVFGSAGAKLLPMLGSLKELRKDAQNKGLIPSEQAVQQAAELSSAFKDVKQSLMAIAFEAGAAVAPLAKDLLKSVVTVTTATIKWIKENQGVIRTVAMIGAGLLAAGGVITAVGAGLVGLGTVLGGIATVITGIGTAVGLLLSPIGLLTAGLVGGIYAWTKWTSSGQDSVNVPNNSRKKPVTLFTASWPLLVHFVQA